MMKTTTTDSDRELIYIRSGVPRQYDNDFYLRDMDVAYKYYRTEEKKWHERFLSIARETASWSKDPSSKIGAVVVRDRRILSQGYNGFPRDIHDHAHVLGLREEKLKLMVHAEQNCIYNACYNGISLADSTIYVYGLPTCNQCALGIIQVGIRHVVFPKQKYPRVWVESFLHGALPVFKEAGVEVYELTLPEPMDVRGEEVL